MKEEEEKKNKKVIAIYARKSKATDKGESLQVQIEKCKQLALYKFSTYELEFLIYEEKEGKTGANLEREKYKTMMDDITRGYHKIDILLVYKLDRLTRSVQDFTEIYHVLNQYGTEFISVKEDFDTTTPMGRAMITITVVFAQLEREVIAERIQDSLMELAKTGRWLGGNPPLGYQSKKIYYQNMSGMEKGRNYLSMIPSEAELVKKIYDSYLYYGSLTKVEGELLKHKYRTRNDMDFRRYSLRFILTNPVYCVADQESYEYMLKEGYGIYSPQEGFDGNKGIMAYNKTLGVKSAELDLVEGNGRWKNKKDWIIALGEHDPIISSGDWIRVQEMIIKNKDKSYRASPTTAALLSGVLRCSCGHLMRPKTTGYQKNGGERGFYYLCQLKERSKGARCQSRNIPGNWLDAKVVAYITDLANRIQPRYQKTSSTNILIEQSEEERNQNSLRSRWVNNERSMINIKKAIGKVQNEEMIGVLLEELDKYYQENKEIGAKLYDLEEKNKDEIYEELQLQLKDFDQSLWQLLSYEQMKNGIRELVDSVCWDGRKVSVYMNGFKQPNTQ